MGDSIPRKPILWFFLVCFVATLLLFGWLLLPFLSILILGAVTSAIFFPIFRIIQRTLRVGSSLASLATCFLIFIVIFVPMTFFIGSLAQQAYSFYQMARDAVFSEQINALLRDTRILDRANSVLANFNYELTGEQIKSTASEIAKFVGLFLYEQARIIATNTLAFVVNFFLMLLVIFFLLKDGERLTSYIVDLSPLPTDQERMLIGKFKDMGRAILVVNGISGVIQGGLGGIVFWIFGFQSAFLWGVIMGLLAFLPILGVGIVFVPTAIYLIIKGKMITGLFFILFYFVISVTIEYLVKPKMVGDRVKMHPLLVFFAIIGGLKLFGILGIIYGPLIITAFLTLAEIYRANYQQFIEFRQ